jgi:hypothetical protein
VENPVKSAFKKSIMDALRAGGPNFTMTRQQMFAMLKEQHPEMCDDDVRCTCRENHPKWKHLASRCIYDLTATMPRKIVNDKFEGGYRLGRGR